MATNSANKGVSPQARTIWYAIAQSRMPTAIRSASRHRAESRAHDALRAAPTNKAADGGQYGHLRSHLLEVKVGSGIVVLYLPYSGRTMLRRLHIRIVATLGRSTAQVADALVVR